MNDKEGKKKPNKTTVRVPFGDSRRQEGTGKKLNDQLPLVQRGKGRTKKTKKRGKKREKKWLGIEKRPFTGSR